jgi:hypothetical protein
MGPDFHRGDGFTFNDINDFLLGQLDHAGVQIRTIVDFRVEHFAATT